MTNSQNSKKQAIRTCIVTRQKKPKHELLRLVLSEEGEVIVDLKGKEKGRGANIIPEIEVLEEALRRGAVERSLRLEDKLTEEAKQKLRSKFLQAIEERNFRPSNKPVRIRVQKEELERI